ncbi:hypothetical protein ABFA25_08960 [Mycobacterium lepromatosis]|uniref:hypothetical protein n=1 Tax=Mycobacterium lepromatosis TaxID=480418 RepID=UPI003D802B75
MLVAGRDIEAGDAGVRLVWRVAGDQLRFSGDALARHAHKSPDHAVDGFYLPSAVDPHKKSSTALRLEHRRTRHHRLRGHRRTVKPTRHQHSQGHTGWPRAGEQTDTPQP